MGQPRDIESRVRRGSGHGPMKLVSSMVTDGPIPILYSMEMDGPMRLVLVVDMKLMCGPRCGWYDVNRWAEGSVLFNQVGPWWASVFMVSCRQMGRGKCMIQTGGPKAGYQLDRWAEGNVLFSPVGQCVYGIM